MRPHLCLASAAALALTAAPAFAEEARNYPESPPPGRDYPGARQEHFDPAARDAWLADCRERIAQRDTGPGPGECEAYLDRYYEAYNRGGYAAVQNMGAPGPSYSGMPGYGYPASAGYGMVPVMMVPAAPPRPRCVETVEYVTEYVPAPRRRTIPPRAKRIVPDKRVKLQSIK